MTSISLERCELEAGSVQEQCARAGLHNLPLLSPGEYRYEIDSIGYGFRCDGKDYPATAPFTISCMQKSATALETVTKRNGTTLWTTDWELSADNKTLTVKSTAADPKGKAASREVAYDRLTGNPRFAGDWRNPKTLASRPQILYLSRHWESMHFAYPEARQYSDAPLDGSDAPTHGPFSSEGFTMSIKANGPQEFLQTYKHNGQNLPPGHVENRLTIGALSFIGELAPRKLPPSEDPSSCLHKIVMAAAPCSLL